MTETVTGKTSPLLLRPPLPLHLPPYPCISSLTPSALCFFLSSPLTPYFHHHQLLVSPAHLHFPYKPYIHRMWASCHSYGVKGNTWVITFQGGWEWHERFAHVIFFWLLLDHLKSIFQTTFVIVIIHIFCSATSYCLTNGAVLRFCMSYVQRVKERHVSLWKIMLKYRRLRG